MRKIDRSTAFKRDYKRIKETPKYRKNLDSLLNNVLSLLCVDEPLPENNFDHDLKGKLTGYRECHIKPDLLLIYKNEP